MYRKLVLASVLLTFIVVVVGAYVRLADAGLGCPDWPGCYGKLTPSQARAQITEAVIEQGGTHGPVSMPKAWKEMGHRYLAGILGLAILAISILAWRGYRREPSTHAPGLPTLIVFVVSVQATLGMWTVTMLLKPAIVTAHLIGGMTTLALLTWLAMRQLRLAPAPDGKASWVALRSPALAGMFVLCLQIVLGGWVSTNYAALACPDLPLCRGAVMPPMDFANAFHVLRELGQTSEGELLSIEALTAIHWVHRVFALVVVVVLGHLGGKLLRSAALRPLGIWLLGLLVLQVCIGLGNVVFSLPLWLAAAHNAGAAALTMMLVVVNFVVFRGLAIVPAPSPQSTA